MSRRHPTKQAQIDKEFNRILRGGVFHPTPIRPSPRSVPPCLLSTMPLASASVKLRSLSPSQGSGRFPNFTAASESQKKSFMRPSIFHKGGSSANPSPGTTRGSGRGMLGVGGGGVRNKPIRPGRHSGKLVFACSGHPPVLPGYLLLDILYCVTQAPCHPLEVGVT